MGRRAPDQGEVYQPPAGPPPRPTEFLGFRVSRVLRDLGVQGFSALGFRVSGFRVLRLRVDMAQTI